VLASHEGLLLLHRIRSALAFDYHLVKLPGITKRLKRRDGRLFSYLSFAWNEAGSEQQI
jgi:hypothetical protein